VEGKTMRTFQEIGNMTKDERLAELRRPTADSKIRALLQYLPDEFTCDPIKLHRALLELRQQPEFQAFLDEFEPVHGPVFSYSPLLERILKRLQEARLLSARNPDFSVFVTKPESKESIERDNAERFRSDATQIQKLATALREKLESV
jgi:hypothetical protein